MAKSLAGALLLVLILSACAVGDEEQFRIGVVLPLTGPGAYYGEASGRGAELAAAHFLESHPGSEVILLYEDGFNTPQDSIAAYRALRLKEIDAVITAGSVPSTAVMSLTTADGILQMGIWAGTDTYSAPDDLTFRVTTLPGLEMEKLAEHIEREGHGSLGILYWNSEYGVSYKDALKQELARLGSTVEIVGEEGYDIQQTDFRSSLLKLSSADAIFMVGLASNYVPILQQLEELDIDAAILSGRSAEDPIILEKVPDLAEGMVYVYMFDAQSGDAQVEEFVGDFVSRYGAEPDAYAAEAYEGVRISLLALHACGKEDACVKEYLEEREFDSLFGPLDFDGNGDVRYSYFLKTVRDGRFIRPGNKF